MSAIISASVKGADRVLSGLDARKDRALSSIQRAVKAEALNLVAYIKKEKLSGQVLNVRTGTLRRSITARFEMDETSTRAYVGTNLKYARPLEYGFQGSVNVKSHQRMMTKAFGKQVKSPRMIDVRAHAMKMNIKAHAFMSTSLAENQDRILTNIRKALAEAIR